MPRTGRRRRDASLPARQRCSACGASLAGSTWPCWTAALSCSASTARTIATRRSARCTRPPFAWSARRATCSDLEPVGLPDTRPWLDHGANPTAYPFLPVEGESLHQIPVGPVHAGIIEPGHFRFTADGETVVRLEQRLGYVHKGIDHLMHGATLEQAARLAAPHLGRQHGRLRTRVRPRGGGGTRHRASTACRVAARRDGGAGAHRQSPRRFRRDLQRCIVQHHAGALRHAARTRAALRGRVLRPSPDDGLHRARRRRGRSCRRWPISAR